LISFVVDGGWGFVSVFCTKIILRTWRNEYAFVYRAKQTFWASSSLSLDSDEDDDDDELSFFFVSVFFSSFLISFVVDGGWGFVSVFVFCIESKTSLSHSKIY
jgi:hypothetical protein